MSTSRFSRGIYGGGIILVLGLNQMEEKEEYDVKFVAIGMHGGTIYVRGKIRHVGREAKTVDVNEKDLQLIKGLVEEFSKFFNPKNKREKNE